MTHPNVVLIGFRGSGKTTVGRLLAAELQRPFLDTDEVIQQRSARTIADIFERLGEARFRALEQEVLAGLQPHQAVISVGGGAVLSAANRRLLRAWGPRVWLDASVEALQQRLATDPRTAATRPALSRDPPEHELRRLLAERTPLYRALCTWHVDTTGQVPEDVVEMIRRRLSEPV